MTIPLDFISWVQLLINSWISSGSTSFRSHASSQLGFGGGIGSDPFGCACFLDFEAPPSRSLLRKTFEKKGMLKSEIQRSKLSQSWASETFRIFNTTRSSCRSCVTRGTWLERGERILWRNGLNKLSRLRTKRRVKEESRVDRE